MPDLMQDIELIIFDLDGTLVEFPGEELLPGVIEWFEANRSRYKLAIASNSGGVGLRYWMEEGGFGNPDAYPTVDESHQRVVNILDKLLLSVRRGDIKVYQCFAYQAKTTGKWSPTPPGHAQSIVWNESGRKPRPGMLLQAMKDYDVEPSQTLMVGDWPEDRRAAMAAGCHFVNADQFFGRA